ncbi:MAG: sensor histidine kinase [Candidatus Onthomonas sp.]
MNKRSRLRGSAFVKAAAFLLVLVMATAVCAGAGGLVFCLGTQYSWRDSYDPVSDSGIFYNQVEQLKDLLFLSLYQDGLTPAGEYQLEKLTQEMDRTATNFRYRITDDTGKSVASNVGTETAEDSIYMDSFERYDLGCRRMVSYYLDLNKVSEWTLERGTPNDWASTPYASAYYYEGSAIFNSADVYWDDGITQTDQAMDNGYTDYGDEEVIDDYSSPMEEPEVYEEETTANQYYYFAYHGSLESYELTAWVDTAYPVEDDYFAGYQSFQVNRDFCSRWIGPMAALTGVSLLLFLGLLAVLTWAWGWNREGELALRGLNRIPVELVLLACAFGVVVAIAIVAEFLIYNFQQLIFAFGTGGFVGALSCLVGWCILTAQIKTHTLRERSLCCQVLRWLKSRWGRVWQWLKSAAGQWPLYWKVAAFFAGYALLYLIWLSCVAMDIYRWDWWLAFILALLLPILPLAVFACKWAVDWAKLRRAVKEMTEGKLDCAIDTAHMLPDLREHAADLGNLSEGLSKAVEEQVKSQRFKTELITNVSHDLKTPLTSIINYVDLLKKADIQDETVRGYIDVLDRKSQRLKTLTEDLVEASKAASGTIAVQLERLDLSQLVNQAVAEYEERLEQSGLTPVISVPKEPCTVLADGRHLWRILDNLLGNCTKYAMPGTRVYLDVTAGKGTCTVTVKNISADPLNVPADELMKRFVRGDSARSTEGSGLGLSIARNLTTAQKGSFDLVVDGDLFKAIVTLPQEGPQPETKPTLPEHPAPSAPAQGETPDGTVPATDPLADFLNEIG